MKKSLSFLAGVCALATLLLLPAPAAQVSSATVTGAVKDSSGGVIPHAKVTGGRIVF